MEYRGTTKKISQIARELGVAYVLEGSVRRSGSQLRITGKLIRAANRQACLGEELYPRTDAQRRVRHPSGAFDRDCGGAASAISPEAKKLLERRPTESLAAYDLYLEGRKLRRGLWGTEMRRQAEKN